MLSRFVRIDGVDDKSDISWESSDFVVVFDDGRVIDQTGTTLMYQVSRIEVPRRTSVGRQGVVDRSDVMVGRSW